jgi:alkylated DNA repair dioxygenase AlkB
MRGVVARRRVKFFGQSYDRGEARPLPSFLFPLRERSAAWASVEQDAFAMALINEYPAGAPIGWHRDAPAIRHRLGREVTLEPRSVYLMSAESRTSYKHHMPDIGRLRYSALPSHRAGKLADAALHFTDGGRLMA